MRVVSIAVATALTWMAAGLTHAGQQADVAAHIQAVAPFVEEETVAVAHLDLARVAPKSLDTIGQAMAVLPGRLPEKRADVAGLSGSLHQVGCNEAYLVVSLNSPDRKWKDRISLIIPAPTETTEQAIREALQLSDDTPIRRVVGAIVVSLTEWKPRAFQPVERPELKAAFEAAGEATVQVALIPPAATRRAVEELTPQLPQALGGGPTSVLTHGIVWAALAVDLPPQMNLRLTIQSENAAAADALRAKLADLVKLAGQREEVRALVPNYHELAAAIVPHVEGNRLVAHLGENQQAVGTVLADLAARAMMDAKRDAAGDQSIANLKRIALGMWNYWEKHKHFPAPANYAADGRPLLSWRVHILPYLDEMKLYRQFHLDEPWNSPRNRVLIDKMPAVYCCPMSRNREKGRTNYLLPVGNGAAFTAGRATDPIKEITDGTSQTIMVLEVDDDQAVIWTKPDDWQYDPKNPMKGLGKLYGGRFNTAFCDGAGHQLTTRIKPMTLRYLIERADGHPIDVSLY